MTDENTLRYRRIVRRYRNQIKKLNEHIERLKEMDDFDLLIEAKKKKILEIENKISELKLERKKSRK